MVPTLRNSTQVKTQASADTASKAGFVRKPKAPVTRRQRYARNQGLVSMKTPKGLQHITIANADSPLLRLPPEIRNMIYKCLLKRERNIALYFNKFDRYSRSGYSTSANRNVRQSLSLHISQVCHQIYSETATMVYKENVFSFGKHAGLRKWLSKRLVAQRKAIQQLSLLEGDDHERAKILEEIKDTSCPNLRSLTQDKRKADRMASIRAERAAWYWFWVDEDCSTDDEGWSD